MFTNNNLITEVDEGNHKNYDSDDEKEREDMFKKHNFKIFWCNPNDPNFDLFKFLGEINLHISKLREKNAANKANNKAINKIAEDFEKIVAVTKLKELKWYAKSILPNYKKWKTYNQKWNQQKLEKDMEQRIVFGVKNLPIILGHKK